MRGTSNQSLHSMISSLKDSGYEVGPGDDDGGQGSAGAGSVEYREIDNDAGSGGMVFTPAGSHLPWATPQADRQPV